MSNWWTTSDGEDASQVGNEFESGGGNFLPIPDGTKVLAYIEGATWERDRSDSEYLKITWTILKPEAYLNRKIFQKLWVSDDDPRAKNPKEKRDKAKKMLAAIDSNAKGKLLKVNGKPSDDDLAIALSNARMVIRLGLWEMKGDTGEDMSGNWVSAVMPKTAEITEVVSRKNQSARQEQTNFANYDDDDSDVPF